MKKIFVIMLLFLLTSCVKQTDITMKVMAYTGDVKINSHSLAEINMLLHQGDKIETLSKSFCDIIINEKNILHLYPNTVLVLDISKKKSIITIESGWIGGVTRKIFTDDGIYIIKTPAVLATVRGTSFCIKVEDANNTYFCTCNGSIELQGKNNVKKEIVTAAHHSARRFTLENNDVMKIDNNPGMLYHNDGSVEKLAEIINEKIDWNVADTH